MNPELKRKMAIAAYREHTLATTPKSDFVSNMTDSDWAAWWDRESSAPLTGEH